MITNKDYNNLNKKIQELEEKIDYLLNETDINPITGDYKEQWKKH